MLLRKYTMTSGQLLTQMFTVSSVYRVPLDPVQVSERRRAHHGLGLQRRARGRELRFRDLTGSGSNSC